MDRSLYSLPAFKLGLRAARILPRTCAQWIAPLIARAAYARLKAARSALHSNLHLVTGATGAELDAMCHRNVANFSRMLADYFFCLACEGRRASDLLERWSGLDHLEAARDRRKGVLLVTAHVGNWELGAMLLARHGFALTVITLEEPTSELTRWRDSYRRQLGIKTIPVGPGRDFQFIEMMQVLRRNEVLAMLIDRPYTGTGTSVDFFGQRAEFSHAPAMLWQHTDAAVVPAFVLRSASGRYISFADPILSLERTPDPRESICANTQRLARHFESIIHQHPEQWFNYVPTWSETVPL
ncbi:MAG: lysophospholipid acyltransferase family protein [Chthoniobacteraceae bacterium]